MNHLPKINLKIGGANMKMFKKISSGLLACVLAISFATVCTASQVDICSDSSVAITCVEQGNHVCPIEECRRMIDSYCSREDLSTPCDLSYPDDCEGLADTVIADNNTCLDEQLIWFSVKIPAYI